jgi:hypothetical protein
VKDARVEGGALAFRCEGSDPILDCVQPFQFAASARQVVEARLKADKPGTFELFWSGTTQGPFGGLSQEKSSRFQVVGDGKWHVYRVFPFWQKERRIVRLRLDPYDGATFALSLVRVRNLSANAPAMRDVTVKRAKGTTLLSLDRPGGFALLPVPPVDASRASVVTLRMVSCGASRPSLVYASSDSFGLHEVAFRANPDGRVRAVNVDLRSAPGWSGRIVALGLRPGERPGDTILLESIRAAAGPPAKPELEALWFGAEDALPRAGVPFSVLARVTNGGGTPAKGVAAKLVLPPGVRVLSSSRPAAEVPPRQEAEWRWKVVVAKPARVRMALKLTAANAPAVSAGSVATVTARISAGVKGAIPAPKPVSGKVDVGVYYFPGWRSASGWAPITRYPERRPVLGWYREGDPSIIDWQAKWAVEHGITFFAYDWYWQQGSRSLEHALNDGLFKSRYGEMLKFCLLWANHNGENTSSHDDLMAATRFWIDNYFRRPNYYRIDGKPVVIIFTPHRFRSDLGSAEVRRSFDAMKEACRQAGVGGLYLIACVGGDGSEPRLAQQEGYDAVTAYNWPGLGRQGDEQRAPFDSLIKGYKAQWESLARTSPLPIMTPVCGGWDNRPWAGQGALVRYGRNPANFRKHLQQACEFIASHPREALPVALIEAWNELGEGSYIEPHQEFGFGYLDAIREVFTSAPRAHADVIPADVGLTPPQVEMPSPTQDRWVFSKGLQGWSSMMGQTEARVEAGALSARTTSDDPALSGPPLQLLASSHPVLRLRMRLTPLSGTAFQDLAQLFWSTQTTPTSEATSIRIPVRADGQWHDYQVRLSAKRPWTGIITGLRLDPCNRGDVEVRVERLELGR